MLNMNNKLWIEKYRPKQISKIIQQEEIKLLFSHNNYSNIPHLLLYGFPGTGKTSAAISICRKIFSTNSKILKERVLELNASDERGIKIVRDKIKVFASHALNKYENIPNIKIIILDEADIMTNDSQFALRRIIEQYSHITRFILICNYLTKIIPPLVSRCAKYKFNIITCECMTLIFDNILLNEKINIDNKNYIYEYIYNYSEGDLRKGITILQRYTYLISNYSNILISDICDVISDKLICESYNILKLKVENYFNIIDNIKFYINEGYSSLNLISLISLKILNDEDIDDTIKSKIFIKIAHTDNLLKTRSSEYIQLLALFSFINYNITN